MSPRQHVTAYRAPGLLIDGQWRKGRSGEVVAVVNPADEQPLDELALASAEDLDDALRAAEAGFERWRWVPAHDRCSRMEAAVARMREQADVIAHLLTLEQGKPLAEARAECHMAADLIKWYAEEARRTYGRIVPARTRGSRMDVLKGPVGPVAAFTPWNFPLVLSARKLGGALAAGCSIILKGAEETPASVAAMVDCLAQELPPGAVQLVYGDPAQVSATLIASPVIRKVTFTGSVAVGRALAQLAGRYLKPITLELGGHAPVLLCEDADLQTAVPLLAAHKFRNAGQACLAPTRFFVARPLYRDFVEAFEAFASSIRVGCGLEPDVGMGPLASGRRLSAVRDLVERSMTPATRLSVGRAPDVGFFMAPTVISDLPTDAPALLEEPFGPLALIAPFDSLDEAITRANANPYGLAGYLFTDSARAIRAVSERLEVGSLAVNGIGVSVPEAPFGGVKDSGFGKESGIEGMESYLETKFMHWS
ncbi:NAD-dependent succinate-semialdehyde dehydrogenase [Variovorax sp. J31P179]|uniref:NAD-dependent succinate-semialdehyde dehydrogenase n=1 Tax=Variovorax sp. J31P179 TaxID=3053508 RepID=UPI002577D433|nr:NAD-dependent succinate-semialdehyde dehydrogenase [Variovorax sp. J31P179]MDM0085374.1 NAD-dependent succinate-semialdehyde dehydrogenase [Variovorax sp. J31P179]